MDLVVHGEERFYQEPSVQQRPDTGQDLFHHRWRQRFQPGGAAFQHGSLPSLFAALDGIEVDVEICPRAREYLASK
jgi:hypothetical protein